MRTFSEIKTNSDPRLVASNSNGSLYYIKQDAFSSSTFPLAVRHFDRNLPPNLIDPYIRLLGAAQKWIEDRPGLAGSVGIEQPCEIGEDFIARKFYVFMTSTSSYTDWDGPLPLSGLWTLRKQFCSYAEKSSTEQDRLMVIILARSILEPSGKTIPQGSSDETEDRFLILDLKVEKEELELWESGLS